VESAAEIEDLWSSLLEAPMPKTRRPRTSNPLVRPFLKWAGGKRQLLPELRKYIPRPGPRATYYEPFVGGGALFFALQRQRAVINDTNAELINCYQVIRDDVENLIAALSQHRNEEAYYYELRDWDRSPDFAARPPVERAARVIFLNKTCYNGLFRVNSQGQFNVPFGKYKAPTIVDAAVLRAVSKYLNNNAIAMLNVDFEKAVREARRGDFIYFDPPYDPVSDTASFTGYDVNGFSRAEQTRLKGVVDVLDKRGCKVLLSNAYTPFIADLYSSYTCVKVGASRAINSNAQGRGKVDEILVMNYECSNCLR
jgi:DNA adenine methylase